MVTANEGDEKEYTGFNERTTVGASGYILDATIFPNASVLKQSYNMGVYCVTNLNGNTDADADFETINAKELVRSLYSMLLPVNWFLTAEMTLKGIQPRTFQPFLMQIMKTTPQKGEVEPKVLKPKA